MPRTPPGTKRVEVYLPPDLASRVEAFLRSEALGRVPQGSWNAFFLQRVNEFFAMPRLPLGQYEGFPPDAWITGTTWAVEELARRLAPDRRVPEEVDEAFPELKPPTGR